MCIRDRQGIVSDISESGTDSSGNPLPYMTITETGSMRVKGTLNEMNRNLLYEGVPVTIRSVSYTHLDVYKRQSFASL